MDLLPHAAFGVTCAAIAWVLLLATIVLTLALLVMRWGHHRASADDARLRQQLLRRDRAVRELHDELLQGMHGLVLRFQASSDRLSPSDVQGELDAVFRRADQVLNDARDAARRLQQHDVPALALANELDDAGHDLAGTRGARFELRIAGAPCTLRADAHEEARFIMKEALLNAFRHADANLVQLQLHYGRWRFCARVVDDGVGMGRALRRQGGPGHAGLSGMRERAQCVGGRLVMSSTARGGTSIELRIPARRAYLRA